MVGGGGVNRDTDVLPRFLGKVRVNGRWDFCDIRQNRGLLGVGGKHLYRVEMEPTKLISLIFGVPFP